MINHDCSCGNLRRLPTPPQTLHSFHQSSGQWVFLDCLPPNYNRLTFCPFFQNFAKKTRKNSKLIQLFFSSIRAAVAASEEPTDSGRIPKPQVPPPLPPKKQPSTAAAAAAAQSDSSFEGESGDQRSSANQQAAAVAASSGRHHRRQLHQLDWFSNPLFQPDAKSGAVAAAPSLQQTDWSEVRRQRSSDDLLEVRLIKTPLFVLVNLPCSDL